MTSIPGTIHLGFAKCGSTFLRSCLRKHPDVELVFKSNFFAPFDRCLYELGEVEYDSCFSSHEKKFRIESDEHLLMPHFHPDLGVRGITSHSTSIICNRIHQVVPHAKLVLVIRNQLDMMASTYSQYVLGGGTLRIDEFVNRMLCCHSDQENYFSFFYDEILNDILARFPGQLQVVLFEDLVNDPEAVLSRLGDFLGIEPLTSRATFKDKRIGLSSLGLKLTRTLNRCVVTWGKQGAYEPSMILPESVHKALCNAIRLFEHAAMIHRTFDKRGMISMHIRERFQELFGESNARLALMLGRKLDSMGYSLASHKAVQKLNDSGQLQPSL